MSDPPGSHRQEGITEMNIVLVDLPPLLGDVLRGALGSDPDTHVIGATAAEVPALLERGRAAAIIGRWDPGRAERLAAAWLAIHPPLVLVTAWGPPERFVLHTSAGREPLPPHLPADRLAAEIRSRIPYAGRGS